MGRSESVSVVIPRGDIGDDGLVPFPGSQRRRFTRSGRLTQLPPSNQVRADIVHSDRFPDLSRPVHGILGIPVDATDMPSVLQAIDGAARNQSPFLISTPNLNFLVQSQSDEAFRASLLQSNLCPADGMPLL